MQRAPGATTVPQIFIDDQLIGGFGRPRRARPRRQARRAARPMTRVALLQMTAGIDPAANAARAGAGGGRTRRQGGAAMLFTPEMSGPARPRSRSAARTNVVPEDANPVLAAVREAAARHGTVGRARLARGAARRRDAEANRSLLIDAGGAIAARYDKIHMFDVSLASGESWREIRGLRAGRAGGDGRDAARPARPRDLLRSALPRAVRGAWAAPVRRDRDPRGVHRRRPARRTGTCSSARARSRRARS